MVMTPPETIAAPSCARDVTRVGSGEGLRATTDQAGTVAELQWVDVAEIHPAEDNLRQELGDLSDLASVATLGVVEPLLLTPRAAGGYTIVAGHRRHAAAVAAGIARVPASIRAYTEDERIEVMLVENLQRRGLSPLDEARGYRRLLDLGLSQRAMSGRLGVSQSHVCKRLSLLTLPRSAVDALDSGGITVADAVELTKLAKYPERLEAALDEGRRRGWMAHVVQGHLEEQRDQERREAALRELQSRRVTIVDAPEYGSWCGRKEQPLDRLRVDPAEHAKEKCHAATVLDDGRIVEVCRRPESHASPAQVQRLRTETEEQREQREKDRTRREAAKARDEHWRRLVTADSLRGGTLDFILREMLRDASSRGTAMAARWLGLEPERDRWGYARYDSAMAAYAAQGPKHLQRAAFAAALGQAEEVFHAAWGGGDPELRHVTDLLESTGYTLTKVEIDRVTPRDDDGNGDDEGGLGEEDDVARCRICGCTEDEPCEGGCEWVEDPLEGGDLCSRCATAHDLVAGDVAEGASS